MPLARDGGLVEHLDLDVRALVDQRRIADERLSALLQLLREEADTQLLEPPAEVVEAGVAGTASLGELLQPALLERRGARDARLDDFGWWLEELRVGLFAQELKTPQPVSVKRLDKIWAQAFA